MKYGLYQKEEKVRVINFFPVFQIKYAKEYNPSLRCVGEPGSKEIKTGADWTRYYHKEDTWSENEPFERFQMV